MKNGNFVLSKYEDMNGYDITYCTYNQSKRRVECHIKNRSDVFVRIDIVDTNFTNNYFQKEDVLYSFEVYHQDNTQKKNIESPINAHIMQDHGLTKEKLLLLIKQYKLLDIR
ncbi:hypothetical protein PIROE2DRAFT_6662 [Piromyces sp. E2]|nr:hypothetical protein PIROE2DRAFT_6662 [Piromyces sp. E2]|eukprot:OUM66219.1 hypothetical protein PIROE2DRAFT_6662 [Piromyces sp. E2]